MSLLLPCATFIPLPHVPFPENDRYQFTSSTESYWFTENVFSKELSITTGRLYLTYLSCLELNTLPRIC